MVMSADHPGLTFSLSLVRSEPTYNLPVQQWSFLSDFAVKLGLHLVPYCPSPLFGMLVAQLPLPLCPGSRLFWNIHSEADSLHHCPTSGVQPARDLQS